MDLIYYSSQYEEQIKNFKIDNFQLQFTKSPIENIIKSNENTNRQCILGINENNELVTFFVLHQNSEYSSYFKTSDENTILLRSFSTDYRHLRKGYAKESLKSLDNFISKHLPHIENIALVVNKPNKIAYGLYSSLGFIDTKKEIVNGEKIQILMYKPVK